MSAFSFIIKAICILLNIDFAVIVLYFMHETDDRASLIGFGSLLGTLLLNSVALLIG